MNHVLLLMYAIFNTVYICFNLNQSWEREISRASKTHARSLQEVRTKVRFIYGNWSWFIYLFQMAIILVLTINYSSLKRGLIVKGLSTPGKVNLAEYFTKHHPASHVKKGRKLYVNEPDSPRTISACNKILAQWVGQKGVLSPGFSPVTLARDTTTRS